ncbi:hypothetical protein [Streptomyces sp. MK37H]|uniref:hypothetical protein n=1 Tax=Streptomyces sp. MK37H TaxID=2699117 RepID=UPI001B372F9A|nr:hypothetical protein [Streptomyces sp. MK37H]MBP8534359.1 hypothetical protein [Streptomyces sp. MK37H]
MFRRAFDSPADFLDAAREMAESGRPALARLLVEEAAARTSDPAEAERILSDWLGPNRES